MGNRNESRNLPLPYGPIVVTRPGSIFRLHDDRTGMPIPEGWAVRASDGSILDGRPRNLDDAPCTVIFPDPVITGEVIEPSYLDEWMEQDGLPLPYPP